jgi:hypothetical protein
MSIHVVVIDHEKILEDAKFRLRFKGDYEDGHEIKYGTKSTCWIDICDSEVGHDMYFIQHLHVEITIDEKINKYAFYNILIPQESPTNSLKIITNAEGDVSIKYGDETLEKCNNNMSKCILN